MGNNISSSREHSNAFVPISIEKEESCSHNDSYLSEEVRTANYSHRVHSPYNPKLQKERAEHQSMPPHSSRRSSPSSCNGDIATNTTTSKYTSSIISSNPPSIISSNDSSNSASCSSTISSCHDNDLQYSAKVFSSIVTKEEEEEHNNMNPPGLFDCVWNQQVRTSNGSSLNGTNRKIEKRSSLFESCGSFRSLNRASITENDIDPSSSLDRGTLLHRNSSLSKTSINSSRASIIYTYEELQMPDGDEPTYESDMVNRIRHYHVVTTASLPWMTGTAVNPLLRAAHLCRRNRLLREGLSLQNMDASSKSKSENIEMGGEEKRASLAPLDFETHEEFHKLPVIDNELFLDMLQEEDHLKFGNGNISLSSSSACSSLDYSSFSFSEVDPPSLGSVSPLGESERLISTTRRGRDSGNHLISAAKTDGRVTLVIPWLVDANDRIILYGNGDNCAQFSCQGEQEKYIRRWLAEDAGMPFEAMELEILFYPAKYHKFASSIFALNDICSLISEKDADVCILEEPEHLNWYRSPGSPSWTNKFHHVVGVIHTNYKAYVRSHAPAGFLAAPLTAGVNCMVVQANCHRVMKLSGVLQEFHPGNEVVENVHGIRETFLLEGQRRRSSKPTGIFKVYFIGKLLWAKGFDILLELEEYFRQQTGSYFDIDVFGTGPDEVEIKRAFEDSAKRENRMLDNLSIRSRRPPLPVRFMGMKDHSFLAGDEYSIFVNPSVTEVLCTATAEAVAMGKHVIIPYHPSNSFFHQFENCLFYNDKKSFMIQLQKALSCSPPNISNESLKILSWEAATTRCIYASVISKRDDAKNKRLERTKERHNIRKAISGLFSNNMESGTISIASFGSMEGNRCEAV